MEMRTKRGLMTQFPCARGREFVCKNIGDYVQSVASKQYCQPIDVYIEQEEANMFFPEDKVPVRLIMNGWFQWRAENWPPSEYIDPLLISMHISPLRAEQLLTTEGIQFLKKYAPVGCRDYYTKQLLEDLEIPAYFSACMTLTLGKKYHVNVRKRKGIYIVDPYFEIPELWQMVNGRKKWNYKAIFSAAFTFLFHVRSVRKLAQKEFFRVYSPTGFLDRSTEKYRPYYKAALFYQIYSRKFSKKVLLSADYITHWMDVEMGGTVTNADLLDYAEELIKKYASADLVITSRIHAGLPCLGLETPVIFVANEEVVSENGSFNTPGRLGGLLELFRILTLEKGKFISNDPVFSCIKKFSTWTRFKNKTDWKQYAFALDKTCTEFMKD